MTIPEEVLDGAVSNRFYQNGEPGEGSSQECADQAPTALFFDDGGASLIREHAREPTGFIIEEMPAMMRGIMGNRMMGPGMTDGRHDGHGLVPPEPWEAADKS